MLNNINNYSLPPTCSPVKKCIQKIVLTILPDRHNHYEKMIDRISRWISYRKAKKVIMISDLDHPRDEIIDRVDLEEAVLSDFEDAQFFIPRNADRILTNIYGDYMKLPPENQRVCHGSFARMAE